MADGQADTNTNGVLAEILHQSTAAARAAVHAGAIADECARGIEGLCEQHRAFDGRLRTVEQCVARLKGHRDAAREEGKDAGKKAGRVHGAGWAAAVVALVTFAEKVWAYFAG